MDVALAALTAHLAADGWAVEFWHHPVEQSKTWALRPAQFVDCSSTIPDGSDFVSSALQGSLKHAEGNRFVVSNQNSHSYIPAMNASTAADNAAISESNEASVSLIAGIFPARAAASILAALVVPCFLDIFASIP